MEKPLVSICCITYNHEHYIKDALEGFVMQKTTFPFEIVISDDCSKDGTRAMIAEYKTKYPHLIRDISPDKNMGATPNFLYVQQSAEGKYIALCEGDDYWTDEHKLQRQVDYMESHPDCTCYAHNSICLNTQTSEIRLFNKKLLKTQDYTLETFITKDWFTPTQSLLYRKEALTKIDEMPRFMHGDYSVSLNILLNGKSYLHYDNTIMSVYRDGGWASLHYRDLDMCDDFIALLEYFKLQSNHRCDSIFDQLIKRQIKEKELFAKYLSDMKASHSLAIRFGFWCARKAAGFANRHVNCVHVERVVEKEENPFLEELN